ncbi:MAG: DPP IV N-terminal domain-containing protein, partial [Planctomycetota bacterium]
MAIEVDPQAASPNPVAELHVLDLASSATTKVYARGGTAFTDEVVAADPASDGYRVVVRAEWPDSWIESSRSMAWLADGKRFLWVSERTGIRSLGLCELSGRLPATATTHPFEVASVVHIDESSNTLSSTLRAAAHHHRKLQLRRVGLDGTGDRRLCLRARAAA